MSLNCNQLYQLKFCNDYILKNGFVPQSSTENNIQVDNKFCIFYTNENKYFGMVSFSWDPKIAPLMNDKRSQPRSFARAYLSTWIRQFPCPGIVRLVCSHCNFCVSSAFHRALVDVCRPQYHVLIINYHAFWMNIDHESTVLPTVCLLRAQIDHIYT